MFSSSSLEQCEQVHSAHPVSTELPVDAVEESMVWLFAGVEGERYIGLANLT